MKVLCLHGGQQTAEIFENQLHKLCVSLESVASFEFVDAPFLLPLKDERDDAQTRSWCDPTGDYSAADDLLDACMTGSSGRAPPDILLGFSQGGMVICRYLIRRAIALSKGAPNPLPLPKGVVFAGTPDPREAFAGTALWNEFNAIRCGCEHGKDELLFGGLPSLHIVGKKDTIVPAEGSVAFCGSCGPNGGELLLHEHAHSFPQQQAVIAAVRGFCEGVAVSPEVVQGLAEMRDAELDMVSAMYAPQYGEDCVRRPPEMSGGAAVTLPLLSLDDVETGSASSAAVERALVRVSLHFRLPRRYPAVAPELEIINGPAWHSVAFERWRSDTVLQCRQYLLEDVGLESAMILPVFQYACGLAAADVERLKTMFTPARDGGGGAEGEDEGSGAARGLAGSWLAVWQQEDDEARAANIEAAEESAIAFLKKQQPSTGEKQPQQPQPESAGEEYGNEAMGSPNKGGSGGSWTLTIGLIGKPSAGKSTFFNAVTDPQSDSEAARVAAFPFTTIEPNVGTGFGGLLCPCSSLLSGEKGSSDGHLHHHHGLRAGFTACDAAYGHVTVNGRPHYRRHPILIKDVAGLVQGAYQGKGKGNQFLNDLCDADVLVHIVDGASATDADGSACPAGQGSALNDISWVRAEVHSWIYDNLRAKWEPIRRVPTKLRTMFSGYRSSPAFVDAVLRRMGVADEATLKTVLPTWGPQELHLMVALYTRMRFPMVVALNKADLSTAAELAKQLRERYRDEVFVPVSAKAEWELLTLRKRGLVEYVSGSPGFTDLSRTGVQPSALTKEDAERLQRLHTFFSSTVQPRVDNKHHGARNPSIALTSTGVQDVLCEALARCAAVLVYPVTAFEPAIPSLKNCFSFKPGTTAEDVFWAMTYAKLLDGKLVRFEMVDATAATRTAGSAESPPSAPATPPITLKKLEVLPSKAMFVRVLSNKRQMT